MSDDNVMYDSPLEFINDAVANSDECVVQSIIPLPDGGYRCACSCELWETTTDTQEESIALARRHTGIIDPT